MEYLYEQIRQFCGSNLVVDLTCPKPQIPKPGEKKNTSTSSTSHPSGAQKGSTSSESSKWTQAMETEIRKSLKDNDVWELME